MKDEDARIRTYSVQYRYGASTSSAPPLWPRIRTYSAQCRYAGDCRMRGVFIIHPCTAPTPKPQLTPHNDC